MSASTSSAGGQLKFHSACDCDAHAQASLRAHLPHVAPTHIFHDVCDRVDQETVTLLQESLAKIQADAELQIAASRNGESTPSQVREVFKQVIVKSSTRFVRLARARLLDDAKFLATSYCVVCRDRCPLIPPDRGHQLWIEIAGPTCTAFSSFTSGWRWADASAIPCLIWAFWMRWAQPDLILAECVSEFDTRPLEEIFEEAYVFVQTTICPVDLGWPCRRRRFYGAWVRRKTFALDLHADDVPGTFSRVFDRSQLATVNVFYRAPPALMLAHKQVLADKRRLVLEPHELNILHWKKLIDPGSKERLRAYVLKLEKSLQKHSKAAPEHLIININQTVAFAKPHLLGSTSFPTLLRASKLVDIGGGRLRLIHPLEHFCVMVFRSSCPTTTAGVATSHVCHGRRNS